MKKNLFLLITCVLGFLSSNAQIQLGITGGADYSKMNIRLERQNDLGIKGTSTYHFGLVSKYSVSENLNVAADLLFSKKGFKYSNDKITSQINGFGDSLTNFNVSLYYIELPVLMEFKVKFEKVNILFGIGPYFAYGIGGNVNLDISSPSGDINYSEKIRWSKYTSDSKNKGESIVSNYGFSNIKRFDYGPTIRFGVAYNSFILNAEYKYGLANLKWEYRKYEKMNNQSIGLSLVYLLKVKKQKPSAI